MNRRMFFVVVMTLVILSVQADAETHRRWVAAGAHAPGDAGSVWRTDVAVLNRCAVDAAVELRLHTADSVYSTSFSVAAGRQQVFEDVVAQLVAGTASGALEIVSDQEVVVTSRTYNVTANGTFGQSLDGLRKRHGIDEGESASVQQLRHDPAFRSNIGVLNMGDEITTVTVSLYDGDGSLVGDLEMVVDPGEAVQSNSPYERRFGRTDILAGHAVITVDEGGDLWAYASVVDNLSGDPTTIAMGEWSGDCDEEPMLSSFFSLTAVHTIEIDIDDEAYQSLLDEPRSYVHSQVTIDGTVFADVGLRLKGGAGSFIPLDGDYPPISGDGNGNPGKSAFIVDFNRYVDGLSFHGLEKLTLNNLVQDDSGIHEVLGYALFREGGVAASRVGFVSVTFNGESKGLYLALEPPDNDIFLERWFGDDGGNLYEGAYGADLVTDRIEWFDQDNGDDRSKTDLQELTAALDDLEQGEDATAVLESFFDLDQVLTFMVTELYLGHWDGYAWSSNNYFIHHELEADRWTFLPWGIDQLFEDWLGPHAGVMRAPGPSWEGWGGRIHAMCVGSPQCRPKLKRAFEDLIERVDEMDLPGQAESARELVEDLMLAESSVYGDPEVTRQALDQVALYIGARADAIESWLPCLVGGTVDHDGDGSDGCASDCNDHDPSMNPGATETCNMIDDNCNGVIDDPPDCPRCVERTGPDDLAYGICFDRVSWTEAQDRCQAEGRELASIHDRESFDFLAFTPLEILGIDRSWIGLNDRFTEGSFEWSDGTILDYEAWSSGAPNPFGEREDCVVHAFWGWADIPCDVPHPFICR